MIFNLKTIENKENHNEIDKEEENDFKETLFDANGTLKEQLKNNQEKSGLKISPLFC